jgi:outer membrane protein
MRQSRCFLFLIMVLAGFLGGNVRAEPVTRLTIEDALRLGLRNNPHLKIAEDVVEAAKGNEVRALSTLIPQVNASGSMVTTNMLSNLEYGDPEFIPTTTPFAPDGMTPLPPDHIHYMAFPSFEFTSDREGEILASKIEATWPILNGQVWIGYIASRLDREVKEQELESKKLETAYNVKQAFYGVILAREMAEVMDQSMATMEAHYDQVKAYYSEGMVSNLDVLQVEAKLASIRPQQIEAHNGLKLARLGLANVLNLDLDEDIQVVGELEYEPLKIEDFDTYYTMSIQKRPEMQSMELSEKWVNKIRKLTWTGYCPSMAFFANYQWNQGQLMPPNEDEWVEGYQAGVSINIPIFDGFGTKGAIDSAKSQLRQVETGMRALELGIQTELRAAIFNLHAAEEKVGAGKISVQSAEKSLQAAEDRYAVGMANNLDVMDADVSLTQARAQYLKAVYDYKMAKANLDKAIGRMEEVSSETQIQDKGGDNEEN